MGGPTGAREIGPHRGGGGKREKAISQGRGGAGEEIVNAHLSLGLEIIPIVHRNYDGWTICWSLPARRPTRDHEFESDFLQRGVFCETLGPCFAHVLRGLRQNCYRFAGQNAKFGSTTSLPPEGQN